MGKLLALLRIATFIVALSFFLAYHLPRHALFPMSMERRFRIRGRFARIGLRIFGGHLTVEGTDVTDQRPALIICNHRSLLDPVICAGHLYGFYLSKAEVANYPLIGVGSSLTGVIFVERDNKSSRKNTRLAIKETLKSGKNVLLFPEGTTNGADLTKDFYKGSFEIAAELGIPVIPSVVEYKDRNDYWVSGGLLAKSIYQFSKWRNELYLWVGAPITNSDPMALMREVKGVMDTHILRIQKAWGNID